MLSKSDLEQISTILDNRLESNLDKKLKPVKKDLNYIKKSIDIIIKNYDEADVNLAKRIKKIEKHLLQSTNN